MPLVDLRSDTVTRPSEGMLQAMMTADVGDVIFNDDPSVLRLEAMAADLLGHEAALFVPSGTMANQIAIGLHVKSGDAVLLEEDAHIAAWEGGGASALWGAQLVSVASNGGLPSLEALEARSLPTHPKAPRIAVLALENTHNGAGGIAHSVGSVRERTDWAKGKGFGLHLDGARIANAAVCHGNSIADFSRLFDTVSLCLSKGLGAPVGSIIAGDRAAMVEADRLRHRLGGGWRQAGFLAAAGLYALEQNVTRLADDHTHAQAIADSLAGVGFVTLNHPVMTNIIYYSVDAAWGDAAAFRDVLATHQIAVTALAPQVGRMVTHLDVDAAGVEHVCRTLKELAHG